MQETLLVYLNTITHKPIQPTLIYFILRPRINTELTTHRTGHRSLTGPSHRKNLFHLNKVKNFSPVTNKHGYQGWSPQASA